MPFFFRRSCRRKQEDSSSHQPLRKHHDENSSLKSALSTIRSDESGYTVKAAVKFDLSSNIEYRLKRPRRGELKARWYSGLEISRMSTSVFAFAQSLQKQDCEGSNKYPSTGHALLWKLYGKCHDAKEDTGKCLLKDTDMEKLAKVLASGNICGMEILSQSDILANKTNCRYHLMRGVFESQDFCSGTTPIHIIVDGPSKTRESDARRASERYSLSSRLFARHIAQASAMGL